MVCYRVNFTVRSRHRSVGIATRYGVDGPGMESRWEARFSAPVQTGPVAHPASCTMGTGSFLWVKRPGSVIDHTPPSSTEVEGRVELYICSPSGPLWPVPGRTLHLPLLLQNTIHSVYYINKTNKTCTTLHDGTTTENRV